MKQANADIHMIGSNRNPDCVYKMVCDEWYTEPDITDAEEYAEYCVGFCREHSVDVFVPRHNLTAIIRRKSDFDKAGVLLLANTDIESVLLTDNKLSTYRYVTEHGLGGVVPEHYSCESVSDFETAADKLRQSGYKVCYKAAVDEGAITYHVIERERNISIYKRSPSHLSYEESLEIINNYSFKIPLIVMPYMSEPEISVDCLKTSSSLIAVPRFKLGGRVSEIRSDDEILRITNAVSELFRFDMPFNIQFRMLGDKPMLLELNPRMSGGVQLSWKGSGVNIPCLALAKLLGKEVAWEPCRFEAKKVAHIETPIIIE